ncbi:MAG: hypothetical protein ABIB04_01405 [Patescibacteria group bacterium]
MARVRARSDANDAALKAMPAPPVASSTTTIEREESKSTTSSSSDVEGLDAGILETPGLNVELHGSGAEWVLESGGVPEPSSPPDLILPGAGKRIHCFPGDAGTAQCEEYGD